MLENRINFSFSIPYEGFVISVLTRVKQILVYFIKDCNKKLFIFLFKKVKMKKKISPSIFTCAIFEMHMFDYFYNGLSWE